MLKKKHNLEISPFENKGRDLQLKLLVSIYMFQDDPSVGSKLVAM